MESSEGAGKHKRHRQNARPENEHVPGIAKIKAAHPADEQIADRKIEKAP